MTDPAENRIVEQLYELVASPEQYDEFMLSLQSKLDNMSGADSARTTGLIASHMKRATSLIDFVTPWRRDSDGELHRQLVQRMQATMALDAQGDIIDANTAAKVIYDLVPRSSIDDLPISDGEIASLRSHVCELAGNHAGRNNPNDVLRFQNLKTGRALLVRLEAYLQETTGRTLVIMRTSEVGWPSHLGPILQDLFDLTRAEIEIIRLMVEGDKVKEIARRRRASTTTVRSQLQSIFSKTDTSTQMECVRMVFGLALMHDTDEGNLIAARIQAAQQTAFFPREDQRKLLTLPDGRKLDYSTFGAETGKTLLFYHDQSFGDVWFKEAVEAAKRSGIRVLAPLRPGFGNTTVYCGDFSDPRKFAHDIRVLLDYEDVDHASILTMSAGLMHGVAAAEIMPDRIKSITATHPNLPVLRDADLEGTNGYNYLIQHTRLHFPQALRFLVKSGFAFVTKSGPAAFGKAVLRASAKDVEWLMRPDILPVMIHGKRIHIEQGYVGTFGDLNYLENWSPLLENCPVNVRLVIGEDDRNVQWGTSRRWAEEYEHINLEVLPNSGYMVHHQHYRQILDWVKADLNM